MKKITIEFDISDEVEDIYDAESASLLFRQKGAWRLFEFSSQHTFSTLSRTLVDQPFAFTSLQLLRAKTRFSNTFIFSLSSVWLLKLCFPDELKEPFT